MKKPVAVVILVVVLAALGAGIWFITQENGQDKNKIESSGTIEATEINISGQAAGKVQKIEVEEGGKVEKDQVLVELDDSILQDQLKQAQAGVDAANAAVEGAEDGTDAEQKAAQAQLKQAEATLSMAEIQASYAKITAPQSGEILDILFNEGEDVSPGATVAVLGDLENLKVDIYIPEDKLGKVKLSQQADLSVDSFPGQTFKANVSRISSEPEFTPSSVQTKEQRLKTVYKATLTVKNVDKKLKPGMPVDVEIKL
jgi:HlyD family secretion protein